MPTPKTTFSSTETAAISSVSPIAVSASAEVSVDTSVPRPAANVRHVMTTRTRTRIARWTSTIVRRTSRPPRDPDTAVGSVSATTGRPPLDDVEHDEHDEADREQHGGDRRGPW
jgi:hypothetical protein